MRSITQSIILDKLQKALASRGMDLKRSAVLEIAAETFGFNDGNAFVAAMKEGRFDPPVATLLGGMWHEGKNLSIFHDPVANGLFAVDLSRVSQKSRKTQVCISPYGGLLFIPDDENLTENNSTQIQEGPIQPPKVVFVANNNGQNTDNEVNNWRHLLLFYGSIMIERGPIHMVSAAEMARIDGVLHFAFTFSEEYEYHSNGVLALRDFEEYVKEHAPAIQRLGGILQCRDDFENGSIVLEMFLPADLAKNVRSLTDWHDAVAILLGADRDTVMARFHPQAWSNDYAIDVESEGNPDYDVAVDILLMGSVADTIKDDSNESDELKFAAFAPDWVRNWNGPFYVECQDNVAAFLNYRSAEVREYNMNQCLQGLHSWIHEKGNLAANTKCKHCEELYGNPD